MTMDYSIDDIINDGVEACRTCGVYYLMNSNYLMKLFQSPVDFPDLAMVHSYLTLFKSEIREDDGFSQYICTGCMLEFKRTSHFKSSIDVVQSQFREVYNIKQQNIKIKTELLEPEEADTSMTFIYVDDLSDDEYDGRTPFLAPHQPIKEEIIEGATVPNVDNSNNYTHMNVTPALPNVRIETAVEGNGVTSSSSTLSKSKFELPGSTKNVTYAATANIADADTQKPIKCNSCPHVAQTQSKLRIHTKRFHCKKDHKCHICGKVIENCSPNRLRYHMKWHRINQYVECGQCGFRCESKETFEEHKTAVHSKVKCDICSKSMLITAYAAHKRLHSNQIEWPCFFCNNVFNTEEARDDHIMDTHNDQNCIFDLDEYGHSHQSSPLSETTDINQESDTAAIDIKQEHGGNYNIIAFNYDGDLDIEGNNTITNNSSQNNASQNINLNQDETMTDPTTTTTPTTVKRHTETATESVGIDVKSKDTLQINAEKISENEVNENIKSSPTKKRQTQFQCTICGDQFNLKFRLNRHIKKHRN